MKRLFSSLAFLSLIGCDENQLNKNKDEIFPQQQSHAIDRKRLEYDVQRWTSDGSIDGLEKIEILSRCGYKVQISGSWFHLTSRIWNGENWQPIDETVYNLPIGGSDLEKLLVHYSK